MSAKRGLVEAKSHLHRTLALRKNASVELQQINRTRHFSCQKRFEKINHKSSLQICLDRGFARILPTVDTGQRSLYVSFNNRNEEATAVSRVEQDHESSIIEPQVPHEEVVSRLRDCSSLKEQMNMLYSTLRLKNEDIEKRISICEDIQNMLRPFFSDFKLQLYGSSINGFGFKGCDIDMSFTANVDPEDVMDNALDDSNIPLLEDVLSGKVSPMAISKLSPKDQLLFIHFVFLDFYKDSTVTPLFITAYVPVIRFVNDKHNLKCDLTCGNKTALGNTKLLYLYGKVDERVTPLMIAIRYWAKHVGLIGAGLTFNTYTVSLMLIYFLQTRNPPVLPTAEYALSVADSLMTDDIYDKNILTDIEKIPPSKNTESVEELFREFFFYYLYFDYTKVICPLTATAIPREEFCAQEYNKRFRLNTICVQDPIKLSHNVANLVDYKHCRKFAREMLNVCKFLQEKTFGTPGQNDWGLLKLLGEEPTHIDANDEAFWNFELPLHQFLNFNKKEVLLQRTSYLVLRILKHVLLFDLDVIQMSEGNENPLLWVKCRGRHNTWLGRNCAEPDESIDDLLERERSVSLKVRDREKNEEKRKEFTFFCKCCIVEDDDRLILQVKITPTGKFELNPILGIFLKEYIPKTVNRVLNVL